MPNHCVGDLGNSTVSITQRQTVIASADANVADNTTTQTAVDTGTYHVAETAVTNYSTSLSCFNDNGAGQGTANDGIQNGTEPTVGSAGGDVSVTTGDDVVCTFTNSRDRGAIELRKHWVGTAGNTTVSITQGQTVIASADANGADNTTTQTAVDTGTYHVAESADNNYSTDLSCFNDNGSGPGQGGVANDGIKNGTETTVSSSGGDVSVTTGDDVVCTFTNS